MRLFCLEVKRILKSRRTLILLAVALFMAALWLICPLASSLSTAPAKMAL